MNTQNLTDSAIRVANDFLTENPNEELVASYLCSELKSSTGRQFFESIKDADEYLNSFSEGAVSEGESHSGLTDTFEVDGFNMEFRIRVSERYLDSGSDDYAYVIGIDLNM